MSYLGDTYDWNEFRTGRLKTFGRWVWGRDNTRSQYRRPGYTRTVALPHLAGMMELDPLIGFRIQGIDFVLAFLILDLSLEKFPQI